MVNAGSSTTVLCDIAGATGTQAAVMENSQNAGNFGNWYVPNPQGGQPQYGGNPSGLDQQGSGNVGGKGSPPVSARSGVPSGDGTSTSCMTSQELNANIGDGPPPLQNLLGLPWEDTDPCSEDD